MTSDQRKVAIGAASGIISMSLAMWLLTAILPHAYAPTAGDRVAYAAAANACAATLGLAANISEDRIHVITAAAIVFVGARIAFWIGYRVHPLYRAFGFASTAYLNLGLILSAAWLAIR